MLCGRGCGGLGTGTGAGVAALVVALLFVDDPPARKAEGGLGAVLASAAPMNPEILLRIEKSIAL